MYGATIGKTSILGIDAATNQACAVGIPKIGITTAHYLFHYLASQKETFIEAGKGGAQPNISQGVIKSWPVPLPPLPEQNRIADKLDAVLARVDACRERLDRVPGILKRFRQAVLAAATSGVLTEGWRGERDADDWPTVSVEMVASAMFDGPFGSNLKSEDYAESGVRVVRLENIGWLNFIADKQTFVPQEKYDSLRKHTLKGQDILFSSFISEDVRVCLLPENLSGMAINKADCFCVRTNESKCLPTYLAMRFACRSTFLALEQNVHGATRPRINLSQLKGFTFGLPDISEQNEIVRRVNNLFAYADHLESRYTAARARIDRLTPSLLAKAFRGELVRQDPNDEPASHLLERISATRSAPGATKSPKKQRRPNATAPTLPNSPKSEPTDVPEAQLSIFVPEQNQTNGGVIPEENLLAALRTSVRGERSGLTESELLRGAASRLGFERFGKNIRTVLEHTLSTALHRRVVVLEDDRYVAATPTIARYDDTFLLASLSAIMRSDYEYKPDDIAEMMAGYLGYSAVTDAMRERIDGVVAEGLRVGVLRGKGGWVWREK